MNIPFQAVAWGRSIAFSERCLVFSDRNYSRGLHRLSLYSPYIQFYFAYFLVFQQKTAHSCLIWVTASCCWWKSRYDSCKQKRKRRRTSFWRNVALDPKPPRYWHNIFRYPFHSRVTAVARKRSRSFCQKCRWQVTAKHTYTLPMWLWMKWHCKLLYGWMVYTELAPKRQHFT